jgi:hypothetical protein
MKRKRAPKAIVQQPVAQSYARFLATIKERILTAQVKVALAANAELVLHYWEIGRDILANQARQGWGAKVIDRLAADLQREFPKLREYSVRNLKYMRAFAESWPDRPIVQPCCTNPLGVTIASCWCSMTLGLCGMTAVFNLGCMFRILLTVSRGKRIRSDYSAINGPIMRPTFR